MYEDFRKKGTLEEAVKRIQQINEYIFEADPQGGMLNDAEDEPEQPKDNAPEAANQQDSMFQEEEIDDNGNPMPGMPASEGGNGEPAPNPSENPMPEGGAMPEGPMDGGDGQMEPGDEVIDVDELTNAQEQTAEQIDGVDEKLTNLAGVLDKFITALKNNDTKIDDLKKELERRNPTEEEKIDIRRGQSGPYSEKPSDAFKSLDARMHDGNLMAPDKEQEYTVTVNDINSGSDSDVARSFDAYPRDLMSYFA